jgi:hypothetical protein
MAHAGGGAVVAGEGTATAMAPLPMTYAEDGRE